MNARKIYRMSLAELDAMIARYPDYVPSETELESILYTNGRRDGLQQAREEACEAVAYAILGLLESRGLEVSELARARIEACGDLPTLLRWLAEARVVADADALFAGLRSNES